MEEEEEKKEKKEVGVIVPVCRGTAEESFESPSQQTLKRGIERVSELAKVTQRGWQSGLQQMLSPWRDRLSSLQPWHHAFSWLAAPQVRVCFPTLCVVLPGTRDLMFPR